MGITIHYRGTLAHTDEINEFIEELTDIARTMKWEYWVMDEDWSNPATAQLTFNENGAEIIGDLCLKGISFSPHPKSENVALFFDAEGKLRAPMTVILLLEGTLTEEQAWLSVKTQYAPLEIHITIVKLLKYLKQRYIPDLEVRDEAEYWETEDRDRLNAKMDFLNEKLEQVAQVLDSTKIVDISSYSPEEMVTLIEKLLSKKLGLERME